MFRVQGIQPVLIGTCAVIPTYPFKLPPIYQWELHAYLLELLLGPRDTNLRARFRPKGLLKIRVTYDGRFPATARLYVFI